MKRGAKNRQSDPAPPRPLAMIDAAELIALRAAVLALTSSMAAQPGSTASALSPPTALAAPKLKLSAASTRIGFGSEDR
jgi:hypothetical protein